MLPPEAIERARAIAESAPPVSGAKLARLRLLMHGPEVPAAPSRPELVTRTGEETVQPGKARSVTAPPMTMEELLALPVVIELRVAARAVGIGRNKAYEYAAAGQFPGDPPLPVQKYGGEWRVTRPNLFRHLGLDPAMVAAPAEDGNEPEGAPAITCHAHCPLIPLDGLSGEAVRALYDALMAAAQVLVERRAPADRDTEA
jgi:hypothetical protein